MWCVEQVGATIVEHGSPAGRGRRNTKTEETHSRFGEDGSSHADRGLHNHRLNDVWQDVADDDTQIAGVECTGGFDEFAFASCEDLSADQTRISDPSAEGESENEIEN